MYSIPAHNSQHIDSANLKARITNNHRDNEIGLDVEDPETGENTYLDLDRWTATHLRDGLSEALGEVPQKKEVREMGTNMCHAAKTICFWACPDQSRDPRDYPEGSLIRDVYEQGIRLGGIDWTNNRNTHATG